MADVVRSADPRWVVPGGTIHLADLDLQPSPNGPPRVYVGDTEARVASASRRHVRFAVPPHPVAGEQQVRIEPGAVAGPQLFVARTLSTGLHIVDSPAFDGLGRLYVTHSGSRGVKVPVPIYRVRPDGEREPVAVDLPNPTSLALGPDGAMFISSRFEGQVYRLTTDDRAEVYVGDLGVPTGLAFARDGSLFVGDRSGSIFRVSPQREVDVFATLPASVAAFHLAFGPDDCLYVSAPTLSAHDAVYRISPERMVDVLCDGLGRPQGLAFDSAGMLYVADALAGSSGIHRIDISSPPYRPELVAATPVVVGLAFDPVGGLIVASNDTVWRLDVPLSGAVPPHFSAA